MNNKTRTLEEVEEKFKRVQFELETLRQQIWDSMEFLTTQELQDSLQELKTYNTQLEVLAWFLGERWGEW